MSILIVRPRNIKDIGHFCRFITRNPTESETGFKTRNLLINDYCGGDCHNVILLKQTFENYSN